MRSIKKNSIFLFNQMNKKFFFNLNTKAVNKKLFFNKFSCRLFTEYNFDMKKDYYKILGIEKTSTDKEIKSAYLKLVKKYHPDTTQGKTTELFKEISLAYEILSDPNKKSIYDSQGSTFGSSFFSNQSNNNSNPNKQNPYYNYNNNNQHANYRYDYSGSKMNDFYSNLKNNKFYQEFHETYTFKDQDGKYKTYTFKSGGNTNTYKKPEDGNPFYQDFNNILRNKRREREKRQGKVNNEEEELNNQNSGPFYNDFNRFNGFKNHNFNKEYNFNYNSDYKYTLFYEILRFSVIFLTASIIVKLFSRLFYNVQRSNNQYENAGLYAPSMIGNTRYEPIYHNDYSNLNNFNNRQHNYYNDNVVRYK